MKNRIIGAALVIFALAGCNRDGAGEKGLSDKQRSDLDNAAAMLDGNQTIDTSPDSLVLNEGAADEGANGASANAAAPIQPVNGSATMNSAELNGARPR